MVPNPQEKVILTERQVDALANPLRAKMVLALRTGGPCPMSELGRRLATDPKILYYPLRKLIEVGLVYQCGETRTGKRVEAEYSLVSNRIELSTDASLASRQKLMRTTLKSVEQEVLTAQSNMDDAGSLTVMRAPLWLTQSEHQEFVAALNDIARKYASKPRSDDRALVMWTAIAAPISRR